MTTVNQGVDKVNSQPPPRIGSPIRHHPSSIDQQPTTQFIQGPKIEAVAE